MSPEDFSARVSRKESLSMAESDAQSDHQTKRKEEEEGKKGLKYLEFVQVAAIQALVCLSRLYDFAKENSGPLKPGVQSVEGTVKAVVGPVYEKFHDLPLDLLKFVDRKVGGAVEEVERRLPSLVKDAAQKAPEMARCVAGEVQRAGLVGTATVFARSAYSKAEPVAKNIYNKYEPAAEKWAVSTWKWMNRQPVFPQVAQIAVPTAAYWCDKYNRAVSASAKKGYAFSAYLPVVPTERISKVFGAENGTQASPPCSTAPAQ